jgi:hypothetical protein
LYFFKSDKRSSKEKRLLYPTLTRRISFTSSGNGASKEGKKEIIEYALQPKSPTTSKKAGKR